MELNAWTIILRQKANELKNSLVAVKGNTLYSFIYY